MMKNCSDSRIKKYPLRKTENKKKRDVQNTNPVLIWSHGVALQSNTLLRRLALIPDEDGDGVRRQSDPLAVLPSNKSGKLSKPPRRRSSRHQLGPRAFN